MCLCLHISAPDKQKRGQKRGDTNHLKIFDYDTSYSGACRSCMSKIRKRKGIKTTELISSETTGVSGPTQVRIKPLSSSNYEMHQDSISMRDAYICS